MAASIPVSVPVFTTLQDDIDFVLAEHQNTPNDEITALATLLGMIGVAQGHSTSFLTSLQNLKYRCLVQINSSSSVDVSEGQIIISNAGGTIRKFRSKTTVTNLTTADLDTGSSFSNDTDYYIYATGDTGVTTPVYKISLDASLPSGSTFYRKVGGFHVDGSGNIDGVWTYLDDGRKMYTSDWFSVATNTVYTKTHNLGNGVTAGYVLVKNSGGTIFSIAGENEVHPSGANGYGLSFGDITTTTAKIATGNAGLDWTAPGMATGAISLTISHAKIVLYTLEME